MSKHENIQNIEKVQAEYAQQMNALNGHSWHNFVNFIVLNQDSKYPLGAEQQIALGAYYIAKQWEHLKTIAVNENDDRWDAYNKIRELRNYWCHDCSNRSGAKTFVRDWSQIVQLMDTFFIYH